GEAPSRDAPPWRGTRVGPSVRSEAGTPPARRARRGKDGVSMNVSDVDRTMPGRVLVAYATRGGSTRAAAEAVAAELRARGLAVSLTPAAEVRGLGDHGLVVLGTALYMGRWHRDAR